MQKPVSNSHNNKPSQLQNKHFKNMIKKGKYAGKYPVRISLTMTGRQADYLKADFHVNRLG
jgi:hypothetical protein